MNTPTAVLAGAVAAALVPAAAATAQKPDKPPKGTAAITLAATPNPVVFGSPVTLDGTLSGVSPVSGVVVRLEADDTRPYGDQYKPTGATATTAANGKYRFTPKPTKGTQYRVVAQSSPNVTSAPRLVLVRPLVGLRVSTQAPRAGSLVRFSGTITPARNGATALVQRRTSTGSFLTVARATLKAASGGRSSYSTRVRVRRSGTYRVKLAGTQELVNGFSRSIALSAR